MEPLGHWRTRRFTRLVSYIVATLVLLPMIAALPLVSSAGALEAQTVPAADTVPLPLGARLGFSAFAVPPETVAVAYPSPTMCVMAALREEDRATRTVAAQLQQLIVRPDTLPLAPQTVHVAQSCLTRWTTTNTPPFELPGLLRLAHVANQDDRAATVGAYWGQQVPARDTVGRAERLLRQLQWDVESRPRTPARLQMVQRDMAALRALGPAAMEEQLDAQFEITRLAGVIGDLRWEIASADTVEQMIRHIPSAMQRYRFRTYMLAGLVTAEDVFTLPVDFTAPAFHTAVEQRLAQAKRDFDAIDTTHQFAKHLPATLDQLVYFKDRINPGGFANLKTRPAPPVTAQYWFQRPNPRTSYPRAGVPTVIFNLGQCVECDPQWASYRRLYAEFVNRGVDFVMLARTKGSFGLSTLLPVQAEVDSLRHYYLDQVKLPGVLGIVESHFDTLADGRRMERPDSVDADYKGLAMVTREGMLWEGGLIGSTNVARAEAFIANHLVAPKPSQ